MADADIIEDEIESHKATESSHEATDSCHEATMQTENEPLSVHKRVKERKKTSKMWTYYKINNSNNKKAVCLICEEELSLEEVFPPN